jgi:hypothetical protein
LGFFVVGVVAAVAPGCGGDDTEGTGGSGTTSATTTGTSTTATSTSTGTTTGDNNDTFETAGEFPYGSYEEGFTLDPPGTDVDFYWFEGVAGQKVLIQTDAKPDADEFDQTYPDVVVTLYNESQNQIAQNDDPTPRYSNDAELFTVLPADGRYFVRVAECNYVYPQGCGDVALVTNIDYSLYIGDINPAIMASEMPGADTPISYTGTTMPRDDFRLLSGGFTSADETDRYLFTMPQIDPTDPARPLSLFSFFPSGPDGSGSTEDIRLVTITDLDATPNVILAQVNPVFGGDVFAPLIPGTNYQLDIHVTGAPAGNNPFYYVYHLADAVSYPVEAAVLNDTLAAAELMTPDNQPDGSAIWRIDADVAPAGADIADFFTFDVPAGLNTLSVFCEGQRSGSGVRDLRVEIVDAAGTAITGGEPQTEAEGTPIEFLGLTLSGSAQTLALSVSAGVQDLLVTGTYYRCAAIAYNE